MSCGETWLFQDTVDVKESSSEPDVRLLPCCSYVRIDAKSDGYTNTDAGRSGVREAKANP